MTLVKWNPFRGINRFGDEISSLFEDRLDPFNLDLDLPYSSNFVLPVDIYENENEIVLRAEAPGLSKENIKVEVKDGTLLLEGEKKIENEVKREDYHRIERCYGSFHRHFSIPETVDREKIKANFKDGILEIKMPKTEKEKPKKVEIH